MGSAPINNIIFNNKIIDIFNNNILNGDKIYHFAMDKMAQEFSSKYDLLGNQVWKSILEFNIYNGW